MDSLKYNHPQKYYLKLACKVLYCFGLGECWYEKTESSNIYKKNYKTWILLSHFIVFSGVFNEVLGYLRTDLNAKERNDLVQYTLGHSAVCMKILAITFKSNQISVVLEKFLEGTRSTFSSIELERQSVKLLIKYCLILVMISLLSTSSFTADAVWTHIKEGAPIQAEVTFYPRLTDSGLYADLLRFFILFHWWYMIVIVMLIDIMVFGCLIFLGFKFKLLQLYFNNLRPKLLKSKKSRRAAEEEFKKGFITGIKLHVDALWCVRKVQLSMGIIYNVQMYECVCIIVTCLMQLVTNERNLAFLVANSVLILSLALVTGIYMMAGGDITYEASLVSTAIFHCGWELVPHQNIRALTVVALQQSQSPVVMTAFGVINLSYANFILVLRSSYSYFAVLY